MTTSTPPAPKKRAKSRRAKHIPQRTCVVCRDKRDKRDLTRIVNTPDEGIVADKSGKKNGRGAYVCDKATCWERIVRTTVLDKALRTDVSDETKAQLQDWYKLNIEVTSHA